MHLRSGHARQEPERRTQGERRHPLGFRHALHRRRGSPVRSTVQRGIPRRGQVENISRLHQAAVAHGSRGLQGGAVTGECNLRYALPVRAGRVLLRGQRRLEAGQTGVQWHYRLAGLVR